MEDFKFYWEKGTKKEIKIEVPGFTKDEIEVSLTSDWLTVKASRKTQDFEHGKNFYKEENFSQSFTKSIAFPRKVNPNAFDVRVGDELVLIKKKKRAS